MIALGLGGGHIERIADRDFVAAADERCARTDREVVQPNLEPLKGAAEVARIEALAGGWEAMVADLRRLPIGRADAPSVDQWLRTWDEWTTLGHEYSAALAAGDQDRVERVLHRSERVNANMTTFATVNGMRRCAFR